MVSCIIQCMNVVGCCKPSRRFRFLTVTAAFRLFEFYFQLTILLLNTPLCVETKNKRNSRSEREEETKVRERTKD
jgi:hypothetical protein